MADVNGERVASNGSAPLGGIVAVIAALMVVSGVALFFALGNVRSALRSGGPAVAPGPAPTAVLASPAARSAQAAFLASIESGTDGARVSAAIRALPSVDSPIDASGTTPLHAAARAGHARAVLLLLNAGASPDATDDAGRTPLDLATERGEAGAEAAEILRAASHRAPAPATFPR